MQGRPLAVSPPSQRSERGLGTYKLRLYRIGTDTHRASLVPVGVAAAVVGVVATVVSGNFWQP